eukprot:2181862-Pyramimonas_sp.AAC.1
MGSVMQLADRQQNVVVQGKLFECIPDVPPVEQVEGLLQINESGHQKVLFPVGSGPRFPVTAENLVY